MHELHLELLPQATQQNFLRLSDDPRLSNFTLVGGTGLTLQIGHRVSEDLDFNLFGERLPIRLIDDVLNDLSAGGAKVASMITSEQKSQFKINTSENLDHYVQDYWIDGAKVTFHSRHERDRPKQQIDFLKAAPKMTVSENGFKILGLDGLFMMKSILTYDRVRSRDLYDLMILTRDHGYTLDQVFSAIDAYQPFRDKDPEHFKRVVTGLIPLDSNDEGFSSIRLNVKLGDIYKHFKGLIDAYEITLAQRLRSGH